MGCVGKGRDVVSCGFALPCFAWSVASILAWGAAFLGVGREGDGRARGAWLVVSAMARTAGSDLSKQLKYSE